ncbi:MAG: DUF488 domain-containing protein [Candidatus Omnitrophica bacterium]|nr:DUF488 domain-containing protein [Candidatus Omnitrophota bacterium]
MKTGKSNSLFTIGHSTHTTEQFISLLKAHGIKQLIDIRTIPKSRHNPQFNKDELAKSIRNSGIGYRHMKNLGGLRRSKADSINLGWINLSFRGFADYMATEEFTQALNSLANLAKNKRAAIMCAEALPWRCHRSLVADALTKKKWKVFHIMSRKTASLHKVTPFLRIKKGRITYPQA